MKQVLTICSICTILLLSSFTSIAQSNANKKTALLIIDIQNFYFPGGLIPLSEPEKATQKAKLILEKFREQNKPVIHVKHNISSGADIHHLVFPIQSEKVILKNKTNSFVGTDLLEYLNDHKISNLIICGMQTHKCVEAAARAASDYGFKCTVVEDACATRDLTYGSHTVKAKDVHSSTLSTLDGSYAEIVSTQEYLSSIK